VTGVTDVAIIGGGILGLATAAFLAEAGASVRLFERDELAAGASGRNSGALQHPLDETLAPLFTESLEHFGRLAAEHDFPFGAEPVGTLVLATEAEAQPLAAQHADLAARFPDLAPEWLEDPASLEPCIAPGLAGYRLEDARPVPPAAAAHAFAARATRAGARISEGTAALVALDGDRVAGVRTPGGLEAADAVVVAAGPWSAAAMPPELAPRLVVGELWGVVAELRLEAPPRHLLEEFGVEELGAPSLDPFALFSLITRDGTSSLGSVFEPERPDPEATAPRMRERGARFVPVLADTPLGPLRACARPKSADGRAFLGPVPEVEGLHVATGHGAWGVSLGPGSARRVAAAVLGDAEAIPPELAWR
jgi:glycine/D-amino acid oxidase-like deaminating enzyme